MTEEASETSSELLLYQTEDGRTRIQCRFEEETVWLTQAQLSDLFQKDVWTINEHLVNIFEEGELERERTIRKLRIVRTEGNRSVSREIEHYNLDAILAVGFRVRSHRGTQFRQWAIARLSELLVKGFTMDDERLKNPPGPGHRDYFDELLERIRDIRDIRASERRRREASRHRCGVRAGGQAAQEARPDPRESKARTRQVRASHSAPRYSSSTSSVPPRHVMGSCSPRAANRCRKAPALSLPWGTRS